MGHSFDPLEIVEDYNDLIQIEPEEGRQVGVAFSKLLYRFEKGRWKAVGRLTRDDG